MVQGLSYTYGISTYPGSIVENIHVSKGTTSVLQGFESITGQINVEGRRLASAERLYLDAYTNSFWEKHVNANLRSEEHTSELQSLMRISYAIFCLTQHQRQ